MLAAVCARAATSTWNGGGGNNDFSTGANWGGTAPSSGNDIVFAGTTRLTINDAWSPALASITFASGAGAFTLSGGGHDIGGGGIVNNSSNTQTLNSQYTLSANQTWIANSGAIVIGSSYFSGNSKELTLSGSSSITMNGQVGGLAKLTVSSGTSTFNSSLQVTGSGGINITGSGSANFNGSVNSGSGNININTTGNVVFNSTINNGALNLANGHVTLSGTGDSSLDSVNVTGGTLVLDQNGGRALIHDLVVGGSGTVIFSGDNQIPTGGTSITLNAGATLFLGDTTQTIQELIINGNSVIDFGTGGSQLNIGSGGIDIANGVTITIQNWDASHGDVFSGANPGSNVVNVQYADSNGNIYATGTWGGGYVTPGTPVPEPATYGFLLLGGATALVICRRRRRM
jgi:hypothetical protein